MRDVGIVAIGRNEGERLLRCLASAPAGTPLVYVDSGSSDGSAERARARGAAVLELSPERPFSAARARNEGFAWLRARHPALRFVQFLDADCALDPSWLERGCEALEAQPDAAIVCGRLREEHPEASLYNRLCDIEWDGPLGEIPACGGVFLARAADYAEVGGMDPRVIAAEEDDLCIRLRERGRRVVRIGGEMARHDAAMSRLSEWWRRALRSGHAYAQVSTLHRGSPIARFEREARSAWLLGLLLPAAIATAAAVTTGWALLLFLAYLPLVARVARRLEGRPAGDAWLYGVHCYAAKLPQALGQLRFHADRLLRRPSRLIEHKAGAPSDGDAATRRERRVGLLGAGFIADWHRRAVGWLPDARVVAVCDRAPERAAALAAPCGAKPYTSLEAMLEAERLDVVHVLLPPPAHFGAARTLLEAGVDVLLEKPMCAAPEECAELLRIAERCGRRLGVSHNFLFSPVVERLARDVRGGRLGPLDELTITWNRELPQLRSGPWNAWLLAEPGNILLEVGSHWIAHLLDLVGEPDSFAVNAGNERALPAERRFYRRWRISARKGATAVAIDASFVPGFPEYRLHARGALGAATADLERDTYRLSLHSAWSPDLDRFREGVRGAAGQAAQAARNLAGYALAKVGLSRHGNLFELSIARAVEAFYRGLDRPGELDPRLSARRGARIVELGRALAEQAGVKNPPPAARPVPIERPTILVLGGSGFIGRELVGQLLARGRAVRVLSRGAEVPLPASAHLEVMQGSFLEPADLDRALEGIEVVYHLARSYGPAWEDFEREEVGGAQRVAEQCLKHAVRRLVYTGTIDSYYAGAGAATITERTPLDPQLARRNLYARAKGAAEEALRALQRERGLPLVVARPGIVIGRGGSPMHGGVGLWQGLGVVATWGAGRTPLPFVLVEDCADALARMADAPDIEGRALLLVGPPLLGAQEYLDELERCGGLRLQRSAAAPWGLYLDDVAKWLVKVAVRHPGRSRRPSYRDFASRTHAAPYDCAETRAALGWTPCGDRAELVEKGIRAPLRELLG